MIDRSHYQPQVYPEVKLEIISVIPGIFKYMTYYDSIFLCCNRKAKLDHTFVERKFKAGADLCAKCSRIRSGELLAEKRNRMNKNFNVGPWPAVLGNFRSYYPNQC